MSYLPIQNVEAENDAFGFKNTMPINNSQGFAPNYQQQQPTIFSGQGQGQSMVPTFLCEVTRGHENFPANGKCSYCEKLMCMKCATKNIPVLALCWNDGRYRGRRYDALNALGGGSECCPACSQKIDEVKSKFSWLPLFMFIMTVLGSLLPPFLLIQFVVSAYHWKTIPNDKHHAFVKMYCKTYTLMSLFMFIFYGILIVVMIFVFVFVFGSTLIRK